MTFDKSEHSKQEPAYSSVEESEIEISISHLSFIFTQMKSRLSVTDLAPRHPFPAIDDRLNGTETNTQPEADEVRGDSQDKQA